METCIGLLAFFLIAATHAAEWTYSGEEGASNWYKHYPSCGGTKQSPVNIVSAEAVTDDSMGAIQMTSDYSSVPSGTWSINNNGHSVGITPTTGDYMMSQGGLGANYKLYAFHFHWGGVNWQGSEHTINGKMMPLEAHFVHYNSKYATLSAALEKPDGLAVLGFFYQISSEDNPALQPIVDKLTSIVDAEENVDINPMNLLAIMGGNADDLKDFYRYAGSLTTPGCYESVTWTVFPKVLKVSCAQMAKFRSLKDSSGGALMDNFRPVQPLHSRPVYTSMNGNSASTRSLSTVVILTTLFMAFCKIFS